MGLIDDVPTCEELVRRMVADAEKFAAQDAQLKKKADARRALEDLIFDMLDDDNEDSSPRKVKAAEDAEEWLKEEFESITVEEINDKYRKLRSMA